MYQHVTIQKNLMGHLHIWKGKVHPVRIERYNYEANGRESDLYWQFQSDTETAKSYLTDEEWDELQNGWPVTTNNFPDDYFITIKI